MSNTLPSAPTSSRSPRARSSRATTVPEEMPTQPPVAVRHVDDYSGNHVVVKLHPQEQQLEFGYVWALYAHLQPGSIPVHVGDQVTTGQLLGRLGKTGNS